VQYFRDISALAFSERGRRRRGIASPCRRHENLHRSSHCVPRPKLWYGPPRVRDMKRRKSSHVAMLKRPRSMANIKNRIRSERTFSRAREWFTGRIRRNPSFLPSRSHLVAAKAARNEHGEIATNDQPKENPGIYRSRFKTRLRGPFMRWYQLLIAAAVQWLCRVEEGDRGATKFKLVELLQRGRYETE